MLIKEKVETMKLVLGDQKMLKTEPKLEKIKIQTVMKNMSLDLMMRMMVNADQVLQKEMVVMIMIQV